MTLLHDVQPAGLVLSPALGLVLAVIAASLYALYLWALPKPLPGIPYNVESTKKLLGDAPDLKRAILETNEFNTWCAQQNEKHKSAIVQVFIDPLSKPWILLSDFGEAQDILLRRKDFDRSTFISDRMGPLGCFQARFKTNNYWKMSREWVKDLMTPSFLETFVGPGINEAVLNLLKLWEEKARLGNGRPFAAGDDLNHCSLDVMLCFSFGKHLGHSALGPQLDLLSQLQPSQIKAGPLDEPVHFPEAPTHEFIKATHDSTVLTEILVNAWSPRLYLWWMRQWTWYKQVFGATDRNIREQVQASVERMRAGAMGTTAVDHMCMREESHAAKLKRSPLYDSQHMTDEVRLIP